MVPLAYIISYLYSNISTVEEIRLSTQHTVSPRKKRSGLGLGNTASSISFCTWKKGSTYTVGACMRAAVRNLEQAILRTAI
jgi:hypothetical protein